NERFVISEKSKRARANLRALSGGPFACNSARGVLLMIGTKPSIVALNCLVASPALRNEGNKSKNVKIHIRNTNLVIFMSLSPLYGSFLWDINFFIATSFAWTK